jgi:hypothetical protein
MPLAPPKALQDRVLALLALVTCVLAAAIVIAGLVGGFISPSSIDGQLAALRNQSVMCGSSRVMAPAAGTISRDQPVVVIVTHDAPGARCTKRSDTVSVFVPVAGVLREAFRFEPVARPDSYYRFTCLGTDPADRCLTNVGGASAYTVTGTFMDAGTLAVYPIQVRQTSGAFELSPLQDASVSRRQQRLLATTLTDGTHRVTVAPTAASAIVQPFPDQPPIYVAGELAAGTFDLPLKFRVSAYEPAQGADGPVFDQACAPASSGGVDSLAPGQNMLTSGSFFDQVDEWLSGYWTRLAEAAGEACA